MRSENTRPLGQIAVDAGWLDRDELERALVRQRTLAAGGTDQRLGAILIDEGLLTADELRETLALQRERHQRQFLGHFEIESVLGRGGMGKVYLARDPRRRAVALKVLPDELAADEEFVARFYREAKVAIELDDPHLVRGLEIGMADGSHFLALEHVPGVTLGRRLKDGRLAEGPALAVARDIACGLRAAHRAGYVHRDVKPSNILIRPDGSAVLLDLGLARTATEATRLTRTHQVLGTPDYMSPEQIRGRSDVGPASDLYSLGATLYHALTGRPPFDAPSPGAVLSSHLNRAIPDPRSRAPEMSGGAEQILRRLLAKDPSERQASAEALVVDLEEVLAGRPPRTPPIDDDDTTVVVDATRTLPRRRRRRRARARSGLPAAVIAAAIVAVGAAGILIAAGLATDRSAPPAPTPGPSDRPAPLARRLADPATGLSVELPEGWQGAVGPDGDPTRLVLRDGPGEATIRIVLLAKPPPAATHDLALWRRFAAASAVDGQAPALVREEPLAIGPLAGHVVAVTVGDSARALALAQDDRSIVLLRLEAPRPPAPGGPFDRIAASLVPAGTVGPAPTRHIQSGWGLDLRVPAAWQVEEMGRGSGGNTLQILFASSGALRTFLQHVPGMSADLLARTWSGLHGNTLLAIFQSLPGSVVVLEATTDFPLERGQLTIARSPTTRVYFLSGIGGTNWLTFLRIVPLDSDPYADLLVIESIGRSLRVDR